jgi:hypothetical protein
MSAVDVTKKRSRVDSDETVPAPPPSIVGTLYEKVNMIALWPCTYTSDNHKNPYTETTQVSCDLCSKMGLSVYYSSLRVSDFDLCCECFRLAKRLSQPCISAPYNVAQVNHGSGALLPLMGGAEPELYQGGRR